MAKNSCVFKGTIPDKLRYINYAACVLGCILFIGLLTFAIAVSVIGIEYLVRVYDMNATAGIVAWEFAIILSLAVFFLYFFIYIKGTIRKDAKVSRNFASVYIGLSAILAIAAVVVFAVAPYTESGVVIKILSGASFLASAIQLVVMIGFSAALDKQESEFKKNSSGLDTNKNHGKKRR